MAIDIGAVFEEGFDELLSRKGLVVGAVFALVSLVSTVLTQSLGLAVLDVVAEQGTADPAALAQAREQIQYGFEIGLGIATVALVLFALLSEVFRVVAVRAFGDRSTSALERRHYTGGVLRLYVYRVLTGILLLFLYVFLFVVLILPAAIFPPIGFVTVPLFIYVFLPLYLAPIAVVVDEVGPVEGIQRVWDYGSGNRIRIFLIALGVGVVNFIIGLPTSLLSGSNPYQDGGAAAIASSAPALFVTILVGAISSAFVIAMGVATYTNLKDDAAPPAETAGGSQEFGSNTQF